MPCKYSFIGKFIDGLALAEYKSKYGFVNESGDEVIPFIYDDAKNFENVVLVEKNKKNGFINKKGIEVVPCIYDEVEDLSIYSFELTRVKKNGKYGYINNEGKEISPCIYDDAVKGTSMDLKYKVIKNGKYGYVDEDGREFIPNVESYELESSYNGKIWVEINDKDYYINKKGECVEGCP